MVDLWGGRWLSAMAVDLWVWVVVVVVVVVVVDNNDVDMEELIYYFKV